MYALVDCNSFFCSVEKVFNPGLRGKPVCVLSSNDGCIVALTPEAKALGLKRGEPIFKVMDTVRRHDVRVFSGNMYLYAAMSRRVAGILRKSVHKVDVYSIDECFCDLEGYERMHDLTEMMRGIADRIKLWTDIPVSVGVAPTRTLAKMGSKFAKQYPAYRSVCAIDTDDKRMKALKMFDLSDVWGIGRRTFEKLQFHGIRTPYDFAAKSESWVRCNLSKPGLQTWMELNGISCIDTETARMNRTVCTSRSFGTMVTDLEQLKASVASFACSCAGKLRGQGAVCSTVTVFISSSMFREDMEQYWNSSSCTFRTPTSDSMEIVSAALDIVRTIFKPGISYKKSGVIVSDISSAAAVQQDLFSNVRNRPQRNVLMKSIDSLNHRYGPRTVRLSVEGSMQEQWRARSEHRTPNRLTDLAEIPVVE